MSSSKDFPAIAPLDTTLISPSTVDNSQLSPVMDEVMGLCNSVFNFVPPQMRSLRIGLNCSGYKVELIAFINYFAKLLMLLQCEFHPTYY